MTSRKHAHAHRFAPHSLPVSPTVLMARIIYFAFGTIIAFILLRVMLLALAANRSNPFVNFIYDVSGFFTAPFHTIFGYTPSYGAFVFELSSMAAVFVYVLIMWALVVMVTIGSSHKDEI